MSNRRISRERLDKYIGKYVLRENADYKWIVKLIDVVKSRNSIMVTQGMDIYPKPRAYHRNSSFNTIWEERPSTDSFFRLPTKEEMNLYRQYSRELILLGTNNSIFGSK